MGKQGCDKRDKGPSIWKSCMDKRHKIRAKVNAQMGFLDDKGKGGVIKDFVGGYIDQAPVVKLDLFSKGPKRFLDYDNTLIKGFFKDATDGVLQCVDDTNTVLITQGGEIPKIDNDCSEIHSYQEFLNLSKSESFALICKDRRFYIRDTVAIKQKLQNKNKDKQKLKLTV